MMHVFKVTEASLMQMRRENAPQMVFGLEVQ